MTLDQWLQTAPDEFETPAAMRAIGMADSNPARKQMAELLRARGYQRTRREIGGRKRYVWSLGGRHTATAPSADDGRGSASYEQVPATGDYRFWIPGYPGALIISEDQLTEMLSQYSSEGDGLTQKQVAAAHGLTRRQFNGVLRALGFVKGDLPYTDEQAANSSPDVMASELAARMRARIDSRAHALKWRALEKDAQSWRQLELSVLQYIGPAVADACGMLEPVKPRELRRSPRPFALLVPVTDLHVGKGFWGEMGPGAFDIARCRERLRSAIDSALSWLPGAPERIFLPIGGDFFQSDSVTGTTARGTPQDHDFGGPERMIAEGFAIGFELVREMAAVAPVTLVFNRGNHDPSLGLALFCALREVAKGDARIDVLEDDALSPYQCVRYGDSALMFAHGDGRSKPHELATLMAQRWPEIWAATRFREVHLGHTHHVRVVEEAGVTVLTNPSLSGSDRYHALHWPHQSRPQIACHAYDYDEGRIATIYGVPNV